jgi:uncharacterized membrane protein YraQ (UPF0718 family)
MKKEYPSAVDFWLASILIGTPVVTVAFGAFMLTKSIAAGTIAIFAGVLVGGMIAAFCIPCIYTLTDENLKIKAGMIEDDVPLKKIRKAEKSGSAWSAPALSLRRVKITLDHGYRLISPKDRDAFISDLDARLRHNNRG